MFGNGRQSARTPPAIATMITSGRRPKPRRHNVRVSCPITAALLADPGSANYENNFALSVPGNYAEGVVPRRLPASVEAMKAALGRVDLDPNHGESEAARWFLTEGDSVPYSPESDRSIPTARSCQGSLYQANIPAIAPMSGAPDVGRLADGLLKWCAASTLEVLTISRSKPGLTCGSQHSTTSIHTQDMFGPYAWR